MQPWAFHQAEKLHKYQRAFLCFLQKSEGEYNVDWILQYPQHIRLQKTFHFLSEPTQTQFWVVEAWVTEAEELWEALWHHWANVSAESLYVSSINTPHKFLGRTCVGLLLFTQTVESV